MNSAIDINVLELLVSKVCHDLISPIGAVNNGIEFMTEMGGGSGDEAVSLITYSAQQASAKLQAFRMAYGAGGADSSIKPEEAYKTIEAMVSPDGKVKQVWDPHGDMGYGDDRPAAFSKMLICGLLLAIECLPKGGEITVGAGEANTCVITAKGEDAAPRERMAEALDGRFPKDDLQPKYVHPYVTRLLADHYGFTLSVSSPSFNAVTVKMRLPAA